jgi:hypothetical protein
VELLLSEFVDREMEFKHFCDMLDDPTKPIFVLWANGGLGKTWLISKLVAECRERGRRAVVVNEHHHVNYITLLREIRDQLGATYFSRLTEMIDSFTNRNVNLNVNVANTGSMSVFSDATLSASQADNVANVMVNANLVAPGSDIVEHERMMLLTKQFIEDFKKALADRPVVVFLDAAEKMPHVTREWLWETFFESFLTDECFAEARFVLATRERPTYNRDLSVLVEERQLTPLDEANVEAYLAKRGIAEEHRHELAMMLLASAQGQPNLVAMYTDSFLKLKRARGM